MFRSSAPVSASGFHDRARELGDVLAEGAAIGGVLRWIDRPARRRASRA